MILLMILKIFLALAWKNMIIAILLVLSILLIMRVIMLMIRKGPTLGFDEDDIFENIFAAINVCPKLGDGMFNEDDIFSLPSFDMQVYNDDSMPPTHDDYCDDTYAIKVVIIFIKLVMIMITLFLNITF